MRTPPSERPTPGDFRFVAVLSEQRSSSTALHQAIARSGGRCALAVGEPFNLRASAGGLEKWFWSKSLSRDAVTNRRQQPLRFLKEVHRQACRAASCHGCHIVFKLFDTHWVIHSGLSGLLHSNSTMAVVLRRDRTESKCSGDFAMLQNNWVTHPSLRSQKTVNEYAAFKSKCIREGLSEYEQSPFHPVSRWRSSVDSILPPASSSNRLDVSFKDVTSDLKGTVQTVLTRLGMATRRHNFTCNETVSECAHVSMNRTVYAKPVVRFDYHAPKRKRPPVTVCIVTMVTEETPTLRLWVYHHIYSVGIKQIRGYFTHEGDSVLRVPRIVGVRFWPMSTATRGFNLSATDSNMFLSHTTCSYCCATHSRPSSVGGMCERPIYMPEQALTLRHAAKTSSAVWLAAIDVDEYLVGNGRWPQSLLHVIHRLSTRGQKPPGGFKITQIQMLARSVWLNDTRRALRPKPSRWQHQKCIVRRTALHPHPRAFGAIHEITLDYGEQYHQITLTQGALLHYRYVNWHERKQARLAGLHCDEELNDENRQRVCLMKDHEMRMWEDTLLQTNTNDQILVQPSRVPHDRGLVFVPRSLESPV
ncbi:MAG: hypothetical protein ACKVI4_15490 [Actinomycetales bacterium]